MSTKVIRATGSNVSPAEDARLFRQMFPDDGLFQDITITSLGSNQVSIPGMYGIMEGRDFTTDPMTLNVELPNADGTGYIVVKFDTTTDQVISVYSVLAPFTPTYEDINASGTICEMIIAEYTANTTQVTAISMVYTKTSIGGRMEGTLATSNTTIAFTNPLFTDDTWFDIYTDSSDVTPKSWSFAGTTFTIEFKAQSADHNIGIIYKNFN
jgi:hypothetical protein